jgi:hypothetical protein
MAREVLFPLICDIQFNRGIFSDIYGVQSSLPLPTMKGTDFRSEMTKCEDRLSFLERLTR